MHWNVDRTLLYVVTKRPVREDNIWKQTVHTMEIDLFSIPNVRMTSIDIGCVTKLYILSSDMEEAINNIPSFFVKKKRKTKF